jgi:hypothetical protein
MKAGLSGRGLATDRLVDRTRAIVLWADFDDHMIVAMAARNKRSVASQQISAYGDVRAEWDAKRER